MTTLLGYSVTCHATMYTGVYPSRHKTWFLWQYDPARSPFRRMPDSRLWDWADVLPMRYFLGKTARLFSDNRSYGGVSVMKYSALWQWRNFAPTETRMCQEDGYVPGTPTLFERLRRAGLSMELVGLLDARHHGGALSHVERYSPPPGGAAFTYLFIGELDHVSHVHGQDSPQALSTLRRIDEQVRRVHEELTRRLGTSPTIVCWSDHGHTRIREQTDLYDHFARRGVNLKDILHVVDTNFARFWFAAESQRRQVEAALADLPAGRILTDDDCRRYHVSMPDRRYGDLVFYLDRPYMFRRTVWGYGLRTRSIHGYLPDYEDCDGVFLSSRPIRDLERVGLVDVTPSLLACLGVGGEQELDGHVVWA
jgi:predicted AlkP superfamily pyrophosphatase or phosphodiesterase